jgi:putative tryptophan/tyrosine transport system substrate-binding protein
MTQCMVRPGRNPALRQAPDLMLANRLCCYPGKGQRMRFCQRRDFISALGGAVVWPIAAETQQPARLPTIGFLGTTTALAWKPWTAAFIERLRQLGWVDGSNVAIEYRWAQAHNERFAEIASEFVRLKVDVIVTGGNAALAAKQTTSVIPIIFVLAVDPVRMGLVASLARPSGNVTGLSNQQTDAPGKRLEILRGTVPDLRRLAVMANVEFAEALLEMREVQAIAKGQGLDVITAEIRGAEDIPTAFATFKGQADGLYVTADTLVNNNRERIGALALDARLPTICGFRDMVEVGSLMSYGANYLDLFRRAGDYVDRILRGAEPGDIPVEQPTKFDLILNLKTAKAISLAIPDRILALANEVIE